MATTQDKRNWYPEGVLEQIPLQCNHADSNWFVARVEFPSTLNPAGFLRLKVHAQTVEYWQAFTHTMRLYDVKLRSWNGGTANCRPVMNNPNNKSSLHAHLIAFDLLPDDFPDRFIRAILNIRTKSGKTVFKHPLPVSDRMHFEVDVPPGEHVDWKTVEGDPPVSDHEHVKAQPIGERPWATPIWKAYVEAGGSSVPESRSWETNREDIAWVWFTFVKPLAEKVASLEERIAKLEASTGVPAHSHVGEVTVR